MWLRSQMERDGWISGAVPLRQTRFSDEEVKACLETMSEVRWLGSMWVAAAAWESVLDRAAEAVRARHRQQPEALGLKLGELRAVVEPLLPDPRLFEMMLDELAARGFKRGAGLMRAADHAPRLPQELLAAGDHLRRALAEKPMEPPSVKDLTPSATELKALKFLLDIGEAVRLDEKAVMSLAGYEEARKRIQEVIEARGRVTASELREVLGTTRRILIPLLEKLDREGFTRRDGDFRSLGPAAVR